MTQKARKLFSFPDPVNEIAARMVASIVCLSCIFAVVFEFKWILIPLAYGFLARVLTGPSLSPLGKLATTIAPKYFEPKPVPGAPKRFAQGLGMLFSFTSLILWFVFNLKVPALIVISLLAGASFLEAAFAICLGCILFAFFIKIKLIPSSLCPECADIRLHYSSNK